MRRYCNVEEMTHDNPNWMDELAKLLEKPVFRFALRDDLDGDTRFLPTQAEPLATGYDVRAAQPDRKPIVLRAGQYFRIPLGFRSFCPDGWWYQLHARSSSFVKRSMHTLVGVLDESWEGESCLVGDYIPDVGALGKDLVINFGERIAQIIPVRREEMMVKQISNKEIDELYTERGGVRGTRGFGGTG